jgi:hypothetical protein
MGKRQIDFPGELGVLAALKPLDFIPKSCAIYEKRGRAQRKKNFAVDHATPTAVGVNHPRSFIPQLRSGSISCGGNSRLPF